MTMPLYDRTIDIPFDGDVRKYLIDFCRSSRDLKLRQLMHIARALDESYYRSEADKWATCVKWLEAHGEA